MRPLVRRSLLVFSGIFISSVQLAQGQHRGHHGEGHAQMHDWYQNLTIPGTSRSCCNNKDCRPSDHRHFDGKLQVIVDGEWLDVPDRAILNHQSPDLQTHVCALEKSLWNNTENRILCVVLGFGT